MSTKVIRAYFLGKNLIPLGLGKYHQDLPTNGTQYNIFNKFVDKNTVS